MNISPQLKESETAHQYLDTFQQENTHTNT